MDINTFGFSYRQGGSAIQATNGPVVVMFETTDSGLAYTRLGSNVTLEYAHLPVIAIKAAQWRRANPYRLGAA